MHKLNRFELPVQPYKLARFKSVTVHSLYFLLTISS